MKLKRTIVLLLSLVLMLCTAATMVACGDTPTPPACTEHVDSNGDGICDTEGCGASVAPACTEHVDANDDGVCDTPGCGAAVTPACTEHVDANADGVCDTPGCGAAVTPACTDHVDADGDGICDTEGCDETVAPEEPEYFNDKGELILYKNGVPTFTFVTGSDIGSNYAAVDDLATILNRLNSTQITVGDYRTDAVEVEILIGTVNTRGDEYKFNKYTLGVEGYAVIQVGTKLIVQGGSTKGLATAIAYLKTELFGIKKSNEPFTDFAADSSKTVTAPQTGYPLTDVTVAGNSIRDGYVITYPDMDTTASRAASDLQDELYEKLGIRLEIVKTDKLTGEEKLISISNIANDRKSIGFTATVTDSGNLVIECMISDKMREKCTEYFNKKIFELPPSTKVAAFPEGTLDTIDLRNINYDDFGAVGDGVTDDFAAIYAAHTEANMYGLNVHATEGKTYRIGPKTGKYSIPVKTNTYWHGASFIFDDKGIVQSDVEFGTHIFHIMPDVGLVNSFTEADGNVPIATLAKGAKSLGYAPEFEAYIMVQNSEVRHFIRSGSNADNGYAQHEFILVHDDGTIDDSTPVQWDYTKITDLVVYNISDEDIEFLGGDGDERATVTTNFIAAPFQSVDRYTRRNIYITRSNVVIKNINHVIIGEADATSGVPYEGFIESQNCSNVTYENITFQRPQRWWNTITNKDMSRSYEVRASAVNNFRLINCDQSNFFHNPDGTNSNNGMMGTSYCRNMYVENCFMNTVDAHRGVYNLTIKNTTLVYLSIIGAGTLDCDGVTFYATRDNSSDAHGIWIREDYGSTFEGEFYLKDITIRYNKTKSQGVPVDRSEITIISATHRADHYYGYQTYLPKNVYIDGVDAVEIEISVDGNGVRTETEVARNARPVYIYPSDISDLTVDISDPYGGGGVNPYIGTENFYFKNCEDIELIYPTAPQFKNSTVNIYDEETDTYIKYVNKDGEYVLPEE